jgi:hypothetical protein
MNEETPSYTPPAEKGRGRGGMLKWIIIIIIILAVLYYFAPDVLFNAIDFVRETIGI